MRDHVIARPVEDARLRLASCFFAITHQRVHVPSSQTLTGPGVFLPEMRNSRTSLSLLVLLTLLAFPLHGGEPIDAEVLAVRESAWRAWFVGDEAALLAMLPEEFLAIGWGGAEISGRAATIASSRAFKASGGRLVSLSFPETRAQRFGDTVVLYGSYEVTIGTGTKEEHVRGRLTEVFVKRDGRWLHPGWHLDAR
jgi:ketosteroid isomerase-like protein